MQQNYLLRQLLAEEKLHPEGQAEGNPVHSLPAVQIAGNKVFLSVEDLPVLLF
ncbi:hypothetical protein D3C78_1814820 [compost metagenome]